MGGLGEKGVLRWDRLLQQYAASNACCQNSLTRNRTCDMAIVDGPVQRTGAVREILSIYLRDSDSNLIQVANDFNPLKGE